MPPQRIIGSKEVHAAIERLSALILDKHPKPKDLFVLGIANGGATLARRIAANLGVIRTGDLDISFHRDDIGHHPIPKEFSPTLLPGDVNGATVLLVDDVLFTGRTIKAALDELFDHGRPASVELAVLVDRGGRRLPVKADYVGMQLETLTNKKVAVYLDETTPSKDKITIVAQ